jgi:F-type H+-transporting ATPase subunit delta
MAENATVARPYARAAFARAREQNALAAWSQVLAVGSGVARDASAAALFSNPRVEAGQLVDFIAGVATGAGAPASPEARNFLALLQENGRLALLPEIAEQFEALRAEAENTLDVEVTSALALSGEQRARLETALGKRFDRKIRLHEKVDEALVGGAIVRAGDLVIDGSLRGSLARLEQQMSQP